MGVADSVDGAGSIEWADCRGLPRRNLVPWLHSSVLERTVREHLIEGRSVQEYVIAERPLLTTE